MTTTNDLGFSHTQRFERSVAAFDRENERDPNVVVDREAGGARRPRELVQAERLSRWVLRLAPDASEALRLAARSQHLCRWEIPRATYPEGRIGYLEWRKGLSHFHADRSSAILKREGYDEGVILRVRAINEKKNIKGDSEVQVMEDALCLAFLEHEIDEFAAKHAPEKIVDIIQKTWRKMSERGHEEALRLDYSDAVKTLIGKALSPET